MLSPAEDAILEVSRHQREYDPALTPDLVKTEAVSLIQYIGKGKLTMGQYANAHVAMLASDVPTWISNGDGSYRSQDGRTLIERVKT